MKRNALKSLFVVSSALVASSFAQANVQSHYERLGGIHKIAAYVDRSVEAQAADPLLMTNQNNMTVMKLAGKPAIKFFLTMELAHLSGGPEQYGGPDCGSVLAWINFTPEQKERMMALDMKAMADTGFSAEVQKELGALFQKQFMMAKKGWMPKPEPMKDKKSLYARLGGIVAISAVVDEFVNQLGADPVIGSNPHTVKALTDGHMSVPGLKTLVTQQLAEAAGGPWKYAGRSMAKSHQGLGISEKEWEVGAGILKRVLDKFHVPAKEQAEVLTVISSTKKDIVGK